MRFKINAYIFICNFYMCSEQHKITLVCKKSINIGIVKVPSGQRASPVKSGEGDSEDVSIAGVCLHADLTSTHSVVCRLWRN